MSNERRDITEQLERQMSLNTNQKYALLGVLLGLKIANLHVKDETLFQATG